MHSQSKLTYTCIHKHLLACCLHTSDAQLYCLGYNTTLYEMHILMQSDIHTNTYMHLFLLMHTYMYMYIWYMKKIFYIFKCSLTKT